MKILNESILVENIITLMSTSMKDPLAPTLHKVLQGLVKKLKNVTGLGLIPGNLTVKYNTDTGEYEAFANIGLTRSFVIHIIFEFDNTGNIKTRVARSTNASETRGNKLDDKHREMIESTINEFWPIMNDQILKIFNNNEIKESNESSINKLKDKMEYYSKAFAKDIPALRNKLFTYYNKMSGLTKQDIIDYLQSEDFMNLCLSKYREEYRSTSEARKSVEDSVQLFVQQAQSMLKDKSMNEATWSPVEFDETTGEYYSRPGNEFDGIDPQTQNNDEELNEGLQYIESINSRKGIRAPKTLTESNIKDIYYHDDLGGIKRGQWLNVKEQDGRTYAKWNFEPDEESNWSDVTDSIKELPYHNFVGERPAKMFSFGGWRHWMDDEVDKFYEIEKNRIDPDFKIGESLKEAFNYNEIQSGDLVNFGSQGNLYVCNAEYSDNYFWVTDEESERHNRNASGWTISKDLAEYIVDEDDDLNEALGRDYSHIPEVKQINYSNNKNGNLLPYLDCNRFKAALEETGLEALKIKSVRLRNVSLQDLRDEFGGRGMEPWRWRHDFDSSVPIRDGNEFDIFWKGEFPKVEEKLQNEKEDASKEKENAKLNEEVEVPTLEGPNEGAEYGLSELINAAIQHELETVNEYNVLALNARAEGYDDIASVIDEINTEENKHIGQLQELLKTISPNAQAIVAGETEASDDLVNIETK